MTNAAPTAAPSALTVASRARTAAGLALEAAQRRLLAVERLYVVPARHADYRKAAQEVGSAKAAVTDAETALLREIVKRPDVCYPEDVARAERILAALDSRLADLAA